MTHGEEPGPETHTDSAVLTYLEGLLMHPVAAGPGATATRRSEAARGNQEAADNLAQPFQLPQSPSPAGAPKLGGGPSMGSSQNLKKARLLCSGAWNQPGASRLGSPPAEVNGQGAGLQNGGLDGSPHSGEPTMLASLLQSFSSRLQSVAMSQQQTSKPAGGEQQQRSPPPEAPPPSSAAAVNEALPCYGTASSRLKGLMRKSKLQSHGGTPYSRRGGGHLAPKDRPSLSESSPRSAHGATPPSSAAPASGDSAVSCAERLKAVANLVKIRSSPAPSPKPSVACSQLALLLSSEAHFQQYTREHALKAKLLGRSASEHLAAMATQQVHDKRPPSAGEVVDALSPLSRQNGTPTTPIPPQPLALGSSQRSPSLLQAQSSPRPLPPSPPSHALPQAQSHSQHTREKRSMDSRPSRPPQTCSSLLLLLLNNHNSQKQLTKNGHLEDDLGVLPPSRGSSVTSDSECSIQERSLAKESSDAESSCYSSCSPIDLSIRGRVGGTPMPCSSTRPRSSSSAGAATAFSSSTSSASPAMFSTTCTAFSPPSSTIHHHPSTQAFSASSSTTAFSSSSSSSTTTTNYSTCSSASTCLDKLTESLINKWKPEPSGPKPPQAKELEKSPELRPRPKVTLMSLLLERRSNDMSVPPDLPQDVTQSTGMMRGPSKGLSPWDEGRTHSPLVDRSGPLPPPLPHYSSLGRDQGSTPSPYSSYPSPHVQSSPLDLCKSKAYPSEKASEPAFSASKLLQNLAQCGTASPSPPTAPVRDTGQELDSAGRPMAILERLNAPVVQMNFTGTSLSDGPSGSGAPPFGRRGEVGSPPSSSQIENLLERRTVLQLLLGTGSTGFKERCSSGGSGRRSVEAAACFEKPHGPSVICDSSNVPPPMADVKVKVEPTEELGVSAAITTAAIEDTSSRKRRESHERRSPLLPDPQQGLKAEPRPAGEFIAKYGLLSQLLKQQTTTYYTSSAQTTPRPGPVKEEQAEYQGPSPKKKRPCPELAESLNHSSPLQRRPEMRGSGSSEVVLPHEAPSNHLVVKEEEPPARSPRTEAFTRESRGFNVLKQLLLSDNCLTLKELSQQPTLRGGGGVPSPSSVLQANGKANGSIVNQQGYNHDLLRWHPQVSTIGSPLLTEHLRLPPRVAPGDDAHHRPTPWSRHPAPCQDSTKRDPPPPVKRESESPVLWGGRGGEGEEDGCDSSPDSPRLTRSNPILYYMLQKGSREMMRRELMMRDQAEGLQGGAGVRVKEEPVSDMHAYDHRLSSAHKSPPPHNDKHSHRGQRLSESSNKW